MVLLRADLTYEPGPAEACVDTTRTFEAARDDARPGVPRLSIEGVTHRYGQRTAVDAVTLSIEPGEVMCLLGPSGSGKSTLLRLLAGLERPAAGRVALDGVEMAGPGVFVEPEHRRVGMVFQDYALFPHLTVAANVAFGLRGLPRADAKDRVAHLLHTVGLETRASSYPHMLSGGERQRVALARALAPRPHILLMDEPFSGLDRYLRDQVREETGNILRATGTTTLMVTHDANEALRFADRIAVLEGGRLVQVGRPDDLYRRPEARQTARAFGAVNEFHVICTGGHVETPVGRFASDLGERTPARVCIRPQHIVVSSQPGGAPARVLRTTFLGDATEILLRLEEADGQLLARVPGPAPVATGDRAYVTVAADDVFVVVLPAAV